MGIKSKIQQAIGRDAPYVDILPPPVKVQRAPTTSDILPSGQLFFDESTSPATIYTSLGNGDFAEGGNEIATDSSYGIVKLTDNDAPVATVATKAYVDASTTAGGPVATNTTPPGLVRLATDAKVTTPDDGGSTLANPPNVVIPSNLVAKMSAPGPIGDTTPSTGAFTNLTADGTLDLDTTVAGHIKVTGAADFTIQSTAGSIVINGEEAVDDAIQLTSVAGGLAASVALSAVIASTETNADSVQLTSAGGMDLTATGAAGKDIDIVCTFGSINFNAGENIATSMVFTNKGMDINTTGAAGQDIDITNTGGSINVTATENNSGAVIIQANGGASERVTLLSSQGTGADSINLSSTVGGCTITTGLDGAAALYLHANGGTTETIKIHADQGTSASSLDLLSDVGGISVSTGLGSSSAVVINASNAAGGVQIKAGTGGIAIGNEADTTPIGIGDAAPSASRTVTISGGTVVTAAVTDLVDIAPDGATTNADSVKRVDINTGTVATGQSLTNVATGTITSGTHTVAIQSGNAAAGTVTCNLSTGTGTKAVNIGNADAGTTMTLKGPFSLNSSVNANVDINAGTSTGTITIGNTSAGAVILNSASTIAIGDASAGAVTIDSAAGISLDAATASNLTCAAGDMTVAATLGSLKLTSGEAVADSVVVTSGGGIDILAPSGAAGLDIDITNTGGSVNVSATEADAAAIVVNASAGGLQLLAGGGAGLDTLITNTLGSLTISAGESASDAFNLTAGGAASGMTLTAGTSGITLSSGQKVKVTSVATAATPYAVLGTDYFITTDSTGGALEITLPAAPATGRTLVVYDGAGQAAAGGNVTINGNGKNIAAGGTSAATKLLNTAYESYTLYYNGTLWCGQNIV